MKKNFIQKLPGWMQKLLEPDVITQMRIRFVATAMTILVLIFMIMLGSINMIMKTVSQSQSMQLLKEIANSDRYDNLNQESEPELKFEKPLEDIPPPESEPESAGNIAPMVWMPEKEQRFPGNRPDQRTPEDVPDDFNRSPLASEHWQENPSEPVPPEWSEPTFPEEPVFSETELIPEPEEPAPEPVPDVPVPEPELPEEPKIPEKPEFPEVIPEEITETESPEIPEITESTSTSTSTMPLTELTENTEPESSDSVIMTETVPEPPKNNFQEHNSRLEPRPDKWKVNITLDHFALMADSDGNFLGLRNTENYTNEQAAEILSAIFNTGKQQGMYNWLQYYKTEKSYG